MAIQVNRLQERKQESDAAKARVIIRRRGQRILKQVYSTSNDTLPIQPCFNLTLSF